MCYSGEEVPHSTVVHCTDRAGRAAEKQTPPTQREQVPLGHNTHTNKDSNTLVTYPRPDILTQGDQGPVTLISTVLVFPETQRSSGRAVKPPDRYGEYV